VQFAHSVLGRCDYAIKVYAVREAFDAEAAMYNDEGMRAFLPRAEAIHAGDDPRVIDPDGNPLSPCIIMEKGESLKEWSARAEPDIFMSIAVRPGACMCKPSRTNIEVSSLMRCPPEGSLIAHMLDTLQTIIQQPAAGGTILRNLCLPCHEVDFPHYHCCLVSDPPLQTA
jgi:hypothetical protein